MAVELINDRDMEHMDTELSKLLGAPARRALENNGIASLEQLSEYSEKEILGFHGMGKSTIPKLKSLLIERGLSFKKL